MLCSLMMVLFCRNYRFAAYKSFTYWTYGKLGRKNWKVLPSCAVLKIRHYFPEESGVYEGFHEFSWW